MRIAAVIAISVFVSVLAVTIAQEQQTSPPPVVTTKLQPWVGKWIGEASNEVAGGDNQKFTVQLFVSPSKTPNRWTWQITYTGAAGKSVRDYELVAIDESKGLYVLDEKNGIKLPATLFEDSLHFHFAVSGQTLWSRYRIVTNGETSIEYELVTAASQDATTTGTDEIEVIGLQPASRQFATLKPIAESKEGETSGK
ncbi:MAG: hypothetical protein MUC43_18930 [Pirellula sp.]|jgi:hypothetical protein|nr:hypothetical protein [Pirellula sp.]